MEHGSFTDKRDGRVYKTVKIGSQTWMAENLAFSYPNFPIGCLYEHKKENAKYGRLYTWDEAMRIAPKGWRLPSDEDWDVLFEFVGCDDVAGTKLKSKSGWYNDGNGTDEYGFSALPGGYGTSDGSFDGVGDLGYWWSASEYSSDSAYYRLMIYNYGSVLYYHDDKNYLFSVRCLQDRV